MPGTFEDAGDDRVDPGAAGAALRQANHDAIPTPVIHNDGSGPDVRGTPACDEVELRDPGGPRRAFVASQPRSQVA